VDAPLYFANVNPVKEALYKYERRAQEAASTRGGRGPQFIIIDLSPVTDIDASAIHFLKVCLACFRGPLAALVVYLHPCMMVPPPRGCERY
jgi:MFS superfamily sulfate permease-like transporter